MSSLANHPAYQLSSAQIQPLTAADLGLSANVTSLSNIPTLTVNGTGVGGTLGSYTYPQPITISSPSYNPNTATWSNSGNSGKIHVKGDAEFEGSIKVGGKDLVELLTKIEDKLAIYKPNPELEEKWDELRELARRYKELEAEIKDGEKVWDILKK